MKMDRKNRQSNIELLRIVAMFMIVSGHLVTHGVEQRTLENAYEFYRNGTQINRICANILTPGGGYRSRDILYHNRLFSGSERKTAL